MVSLVQAADFTARCCSCPRSLLDVDVLKTMAQCQKLKVTRKISPTPSSRRILLQSVG